MIHAEPGSLLTVQLWDPTLPVSGPSAPADAAYVDEFWVPAISSLGVAAARLLHRAGERGGGRAQLALEDLEEGIGLPGTGTHAALVLEQLEQAGLAHQTRAGTLLVRSSFPLLAPHLVARLAPRLRRAHQAWLESAVGGPPPAEEVRLVVEPSDHICALASAVEDILTRVDIGPLQAAYRWQAIVRLAEDARDGALIEWAAPDLETTLAECQQAGQGASDAVWAVQVAVAVQGSLPDPHRLTLASAAAGLIDWMVAEFPTADEGHPLDRPDPLDRLDRLDPLDRFDS